MAEPSAQDIQEQIKQAQQSAWAQAAAQQQQPPVQQAPANAPAQQFSPPPLPAPPPPQIVPGGAKTSGVTSSMGKISLLAACLSLMLLGALTFLSGFLLGIWFSGPNKTQTIATTAAELQSLGILPPQQQAIPQDQSTPSQGVGLGQSLKQGAQSIGFGQIAAGQAGNITQSTISGVTVPNIPSFLSPLVSSTQHAIGQQLGYKAQQQVGQQVKDTIATQPSLQQQMAPAQQGAPQQPAAPSSDTASSLSQGIRGNDDGYTIQLGVFAARDNAQVLVNHMQALNYPSQVVEGKSPDGSTLYYVHSGQYSDYKSAAVAATQFAAQNIPGALIVKISQNNKGGS